MSATGGGRYPLGRPTIQSVLAADHVRDEAHQQHLQAGIDRFDDLAKLENTISDQYHQSTCYFALARVQEDVIRAIQYYETALAQLLMSSVMSRKSRYACLVAIFVN